MLQLNPTSNPAASLLSGGGGGGNLQLLTQITELTQQLEKDKAELAKMENSGTESSSMGQSSSTADSHTRFLESFQQLIQSAKGGLLKDPRQQGEDGKSAGEDGPPPKFNQVGAEQSKQCFDSRSNENSDNYQVTNLKSWKISPKIFPLS